MIGVSVKLASSRASRIAPTRPSIMSDGATMSAPASACETDAREQLEGRIVADAAALDDAAVTVTRVLAEAHVGDDQEVGHDVLHGADRLLDDAVLGVRLGAARVLLRRHPEEEHRGDAHSRRVL